ncbi:MAG: hypothetical protein ACM3H8_04935 [Sphingobacteriales bacterium]
MISKNGYEHPSLEFLYKRILPTVAERGSTENLMVMAGTTQAEKFVNIFSITPNHFYLVLGGGHRKEAKDISEK